MFIINYLKLSEIYQNNFIIVILINLANLFHAYTFSFKYSIRYSSKVSPKIYQFINFCKIIHFIL